MPTCESIRTRVWRARGVELPTASRTGPRSPSRRTPEIGPTRQFPTARDLPRRRRAGRCRLHLARAAGRGTPRRPPELGGTEAKRREKRREAGVPFSRCTSWFHHSHRAAPEADDVAIGVLDVEVLRAPRGRGKRLDDRCTVRGALLIERLDAVNTRRRVEMLVHTPVSAVFGVLGRFLQVKLQPVQLTDRVKPVPRLAECKTELLVVADRAVKVVNQELWSEGRHPRLRLDGGHTCLKILFHTGLSSRAGIGVATSRRMVLDAIMQLNQTILKAFDGVQIQEHVALPPRINQISLPGCSRRRLTYGPMAPFTNSTPEGHRLVVRDGRRRCADSWS